MRIFFADAGPLEQLRTTIDELAATARANLAELESLIAAADDADYPFTGRRRVNAIAIRFQFDYNQMISDWATWATAQTDGWNDAADPGGWNWHDALT